MLRVRYPGSGCAVLYCHGNSEDITSVAAHATSLSTRFGADVYVFDYPGYAGNPSTPASLGGMLAAVDGALRVVMIQEGWSPKQVVLYGRSLGGVPALHAAAREPPVGGLVLESAFTAPANTLVPRFGSVVASALNTVAYVDGYDNVKAAARVAPVVPVLTIHGTADTVVPFDHGQQLDAALRGSRGADTGVKFVLVEGAGHNDVHTVSDVAGKAGADFIAGVAAHASAAVSGRKALPVLVDERASKRFASRYPELMFRSWAAATLQEGVAQAGCIDLPSGECRRALLVESTGGHPPRLASWPAGVETVLTADCVRPLGEVFAAATRSAL